MAQFVAFLYSVVLPGARLRSGPLTHFAQDCGLTAPVTVGSTGNLVFEADEIGPAALEARLEPAFARHFGKAVSILVRSAPKMTALARNHPFDKDTDVRNIAVRLQRTSGDAKWTQALRDRAGDVDWRQVGNDLWLNFPGGVGPSRFAGWISRNGPVGTFRTYGSIQRVWKHCL